MLPRDLPDRVTKSTPDGKITPTRTWNLRVAAYHDAKQTNTTSTEEDHPTLVGQPWEGVLLPTDITPHDITKLRDNLSLRLDDVFVVTYPKCGTTWMQQIVKLIWNNGEEDGRDIDEALPWIDPEKPEYAENMKSPRGFKTHLPYHLCPGGDPSMQCAKYIHVYRNPKDAMVSNYHFTVKFLPDDVPWADYYQMMMSGNVYYGHIIDHIKGWYIHKDCPNILSIGYEFLKKEPFKSIKTISTFLNYHHSDEVLLKIAQATTFEAMKSNSLANNSWMDEYRREGTAFMRKGIVGDWRTLFTDEQSAEVDAMVTDKMKDLDLVFDY